MVINSKCQNKPTLMPGADLHDMNELYSDTSFCPDSLRKTSSEMTVINVNMVDNAAATP
ncbi:hypothetical protein D3C78_1950400 [compost metagenome]